MTDQKLEKVIDKVNEMLKQEVFLESVLKDRIAAREELVVEITKHLKRAEIDVNEQVIKEVISKLRTPNFVLLSEAEILDNIRTDIIAFYKNPANSEFLDFIIKIVNRLNKVTETRITSIYDKEITKEQQDFMGIFINSSKFDVYLSKINPKEFIAVLPNDTINEDQFSIISKADEIYKLHILEFFYNPNFTSSQNETINKINIWIREAEKSVRTISSIQPDLELLNRLSERYKEIYTIEQDVLDFGKFEDEGFIWEDTILEYYDQESNSLVLQEINLKDEHLKQMPESFFAREYLKATTGLNISSNLINGLLITLKTQYKLNSNITGLQMSEVYYKTFAIGLMKLVSCKKFYNSIFWGESDIFIPFTELFAKLQANEVPILNARKILTLVANLEILLERKKKTISDLIGSSFVVALSNIEHNLEHSEQIEAGIIKGQEMLNLSFKDQSDLPPIQSNDDFEVIKKYAPSTPVWFIDITEKTFNSLKNLEKNTIKDIEREIVSKILNKEIIGAVTKDTKKAITKRSYRKLKDGIKANIALKNNLSSFSNSSIQSTLEKLVKGT